MYVPRIGDAFVIEALVPIMPLHTDDLEGVKGVPQMRRVENPEVVILEVKPRALTGSLWYRVSLRDGTEGWINSVALLSKSLVPA